MNLTQHFTKEELIYSESEENKVNEITENLKSIKEYLPKYF